VKPHEQARDSRLCKAAARYLDAGDIANARRAHRLAVRLTDREKLMAKRKQGEQLVECNRARRETKG